MGTKSVFVENVGIDLLRKQRDGLLIIADKHPESWADETDLDGLINLLDTMLDNAEGFGNV